MFQRKSRDRRKWEELYASGKRPDRPPSRWVVETLGRLPNDLPVLDVAGGTGRHVAAITRPGRLVVLTDIVLHAVATARKANTALQGVVADAVALPFRPASFGIVMVTNFLDRSLFPKLISLLEPGGFLVYETYTTAHLDLVQRGLARGPQSNAYLLRPGELPELVRSLEVIEYWEGELEDDAGRRCCARFIGQEARGQRPEARV